MKLFVDDFRTEYSVNWIQARTYKDAITILETGKVTHLSLDHDLGTKKTGYDILLWLEKKAAGGDFSCVPKSIRIHSANPVGRQKMEQAIKSIKELREKGELYGNSNNFNI